MKRVLFLSSLILTASCGTSPNIETQSKLTGDERNKIATAVANARLGEFPLDKYFSDSRVLKNACIVGFRYKATVNDNTANSKSEVSQSMGNGREMVTTTNRTYEFKPSPAYFQAFTDYAYDRFASELKRYGYNVIDKAVLNQSKAYTSKGENGNSSDDTNAQYSGYYHLDPRNVRYYDYAGYSVNRMLAADDDWSKEFYEQTNCDIYFNAEMLVGMKVLGSEEVDGIKAIGIGAATQFSFNANVPWAKWETSMKEIDSKIWANNNHGGTSAIKKPINQSLVYPMGENPGTQEAELEKLSTYSNNQLKAAINYAVDYSLRAFHLEVYTQKKVPTTPAN